MSLEDPASIKEFEMDQPMTFDKSLAAYDDSTLVKAREELQRKRKLRGQIDEYLAKNIAEKIRLGGKDELSQEEQEYVARLDVRYNEMSERNDDINQRIESLKKFVGETGDELPLARMAILKNSDGSSAEVAQKWWRKTTKQIAGSVKNMISRWQTRFFGKSEQAVVDDQLRTKEAQSIVSEVDSPVGEIEVRGWGSLENNSDPYEEVRYVRGTGPDPGVLVEADAKLLGGEGENAEHERVRRIQEQRLRDQMGFAKAPIISAERQFGAHTDAEYLVEEITAERAMRDLRELKEVYKAILEKKKNYPRDAEVFEAQAEVVRKTYVGMLEAAKRTIALELREKPDEVRKKRLMQDFASVMAEIRNLEEVSSKEDRKAA